MPSYITGFRADLDRGYLTLIHAPPAVRLTLAVNSTLVEGTTPMAITITDSQKFTATVSVTDAKGNPATLDGDPIWTVSDATLMLLTVNPATPATADVAAVGPLGVGQLTVTADADRGEGVRTLTGILSVTVIGGEAVSLEIATTAPVEQ